MIDWHEVVVNGLWLLGLALLLCTFSFAGYSGQRDHLPVRQIWANATAGAWSKPGAILFCAGMALTSATIFEQGGWLLLILVVLYGWWRSSRQLATTPDPLNQPPPDQEAAPAIAIAPLQRFARWIISTELLWLGLLAPFFLFPSTGYLLPLIGLPLLWLIRYLAYRRFIARTALDWPILLLLMMVLVSIYATPDLGFSLGKITGVLFGIGLYYGLVEWSSAGNKLYWVLGGYVLAGVALSVVGLLGTDWVNKWAALSQYLSLIPAAIRGLPGAENGLHSNEVGGALVWVIPLQFALCGWLLLRRGPGLLARWLLGLALLGVILFSGAVLVLTQSRGAIIGLLLGLALLLWLTLPWARLPFTLLLATSSAALIYIGPDTVLDRLTTAGLRVGSSYDLFSVDGRLEIWSRAIYGIEDFPFTGMGMNSFRKIMPILYPLSSSVAIPGGGKDIAHAHNQFLQAALDLGLPGLIAYIAIVIGGAALALLSWRRSSTPLLRSVAAGIAAAMLANLVFGMTDAITLGAKPGVFFWALLGLAAALWQHALATTPRPATIPAPAARSTQANTLDAAGFDGTAQEPGS